MKDNSWRFLIILALVFGYLTACATYSTTPPAFDAQPVSDGTYNPKVDYLYFNLDASSSMTEVYGKHTKFDTAKSVVENFNKTMPSVDTMVALRSFGHHKKVSKKSSDLMVEPSTYDPSSLDGGLEKVSKAGGISALSRALKEAANDFKEVKDPIAMVIVSDGKDMAHNTLAAAAELKADHGDQLCIYTVQVGDNAAGGKLLSQLSEVTGCGKAVTADNLSTGAEMNAFVKEVLLSELADSDGDGVPDDKDKCRDTPSGVEVDMDGCPLDGDKDGVPDFKDKCPDTQAGIKVDASGCLIPVPTKSAEVTAAGTWIYKDIQFELNKSDLKESSYPTLDEIAEALKSQPELNIEIQGHSDSMGGRDYNVSLSEKRAQAVMSYLVSKGIDSSRMTSKGLGPDKPLDSNKTKEGRARNRRVEIKPLQ